jgi:hypothetical protein
MIAPHMVLISALFVAIFFMADFQFEKEYGVGIRESKDLES